MGEEKEQVREIDRHIKYRYETGAHSVMVTIVGTNPSSNNGQGCLHFT